MSVHDVNRSDATLLAREHALLSNEERIFVTHTRYEAARIIALQMIVLAALLLVWWAVSGTLVDRLFLSDPISVARVLYEIIIDGTLWWHLEWTLVEMTLGYILGVSVGLILAIAITGIPWEWAR